LNAHRDGDGPPQAPDDTRLTELDAVLQDERATLALGAALAASWAQRRRRRNVASASR
jgi:hypothetical protein